MESFLINYKNVIDKKIKDLLNTFGDDNNLKSACEYALMNGGKRFRPAIVMMIADALKNNADVSLAAVGMEFFHTASLIADDLPCMDNDDFRRSKPSTHKVYGEAVALLASYALIAAGYRAVYENFRSLQNEVDNDVLSLVLDNITHNTGIQGATGGQFFDIFVSNRSLERMKEIIRMKTVTLFETSFIVGWLFGGGDPEKVEEVKKNAYHFGMAFQIQDDLDDIDQDLHNKREVNMGIYLGEQDARDAFFNELQAAKKMLRDLNIFSTDLEHVVSTMHSRVQTSTNSCSASCDSCVGDVPS